MNAEMTMTTKKGKDFLSFWDVPDGGIEGLIVDGDPADVVVRARSAGLLVSLAGSNIVRLVPPLIVGKPEIDEAIEILDRVLGESR